MKYRIIGGMALLCIVSAFFIWPQAKEKPMPEADIPITIETTVDELRPQIERLKGSTIGEVKKKFDKDVKYYFTDSGFFKIAKYFYIDLVRIDYQIRLSLDRDKNKIVDVISIDRFVVGP